MSFGDQSVALNSVANARLKVSIFKATEDNEVSSPGLIPLHETELQPTFESSDRVAWIKEEKTTKRIAYSAEELAGQLIELFCSRFSTSRRPKDGKYNKHHSSMTVNTVGIEVPSDFPAAYNEFHDQIGPLQPKYPDAYKHYAGGWNAVAYRFAACAEYDGEFTKTIQTSTVTTERNVQERSLFGFFMSATAVLDSSAYALYAVGNMIAAAVFPLSDLHRINLEAVATTFGQQFASDEISSVLKGIWDDVQMRELREIRNVLAHRAATTRSFGGDWSPTGTRQLEHLQLPSGAQKTDIDRTTTSTRRNALSAKLAAVTEAAVKFARAHF